MKLKVGNRLDRVDAVIELTPPLMVTQTPPSDQVRIVDARGRDYAFAPDGSYLGQLQRVRPVTKPPRRHASPS